MRNNNDEQKMKVHLAKRIILVRHGESEGNENDTVLEYVPNHKIKLSKKGRHQAQTAAEMIREIVSEEDECGDWKALFYVSPLSRTRETMEQMICTLEKEKDKVVGVREECRLREQHFGNFQKVEERRSIKKSRVSYGKFFYRVPNGESTADVYDRLSSFIEGGLCRDNKFRSGEMNLIIVSHGLTILLFLMKYFNWSVDEFEALTNPGNCECRVMQLGPNGQYTLALHHQLEELKKWGLSDEMIQDQICRASSPGRKWVDSCSEGSTSSDDNINC